MYEENPLEAHRNEDGHVQFKDTGDEFIDRWEEQIAAGESPDMMEAFSEEQLKKLDRLRTRGRTRFGGASSRTMKSAYESVETQANREGLGIGQTPPPPRPGPNSFNTFGSGSD